MRSTTIAAIAATILFATPMSNASTYFFTGSMLFERLEKDVKGGVAYDSGTGSGYVTGVIDVAMNALICVPEDHDLTIRQAKQIVYNYMLKHPEKWSLPAANSVISAMRELYPCDKKDK